MLSSFLFRLVTASGMVYGSLFFISCEKEKKSTVPEESQTTEPEKSAEKAQTVVNSFLNSTNWATDCVHDPTFTRGTHQWIRFKDNEVMIQYRLYISYGEPKPELPPFCGVFRPQFPSIVDIYAFGTDERTTTENGQKGVIKISKYAIAYLDDYFVKSATEKKTCGVDAWSYGVAEFPKDPSCLDIHKKYGIDSDQVEYTIEAGVLTKGTMVFKETGPR